MSYDYEKYKDIFDVDLFISSEKKTIKYLNNYTTAIRLQIDSLNVSELIIPEGITEIEPEAFCNWFSLTKISLPTTLKKINAGIFKRCNRLEEIVIPEGVEVIDFAAFADAISLERITLPSTLIEINQYAFSNNSFESITIPASVEVIESNAFEDSTLLKEIIFEGELPEIIGDELKYQSDLCKIVYKGKVYGSYDDFLDDLYYKKKIIRRNFLYPTDCNLNIYKTGVEKVIIRANCEYIEKGAFTGFSSLKRVVTHPNLREIDDWSFTGCVSLEEITNIENVTYIGGSAFALCESLQEFTIPEGVRTIYPFTFSRCKSLNRVTLNSNIQYIDILNFFKSYKIDEYIIPDNFKIEFKTIPNELLPPLLFSSSKQYDNIMGTEAYNAYDLGDKYKYIRKDVDIRV